MGVTECDKCKKRFCNKDSLKNHTEKCTTKVKFEGYYNCQSCSKTFSSMSNLNKHIKNQHMSVDIIKESNNKPIVNNIINNITNNTTNNTNNTINNTTNNITLKPNLTNIITIKPIFVKHGQERIDHITKEFLLKLLDTSSSPRMFVDLMATLYFSEEVPENNNWSLAYPYNAKAAIVFDYETNEFVRTSNENTINEKFSNMIDKIVPLIDEIYEDKENLTRKQHLNILHFYDKECMYNLSEQCPDIYELIRKLAFEQRFIPMKTWKDSGFNGKNLSIDFDKNNKSQYGEIIKPYKTI